jgi:hypothetical protein
VHNLSLYGEEAIRAMWVIWAFGVDVRCIGVVIVVRR